MDYKTLAEAANSSESLYAAITVAVSLTSVVAGYVIGALKSSGRRLRIAEIQRDERVAEANARETEARLKIEELKDAEGAHNRKLALMDKERAYKLDDEERKKKDAKEEADAREQQEKVRHQRKMELAEKFAPDLKAYLERLTAAEQEDAKMEAEKAEYKRGLYQKILEVIEVEYVDSGGVAGRINDAYEVISDEDEESVNRIADLLYPPRRGRESVIERMPPQLKGLIKVVLEPDEDETAKEETETTEDED